MYAINNIRDAIVYGIIKIDFTQLYLLKYPQISTIHVKVYLQIYPQISTIIK
jgi:hypothetical protein